MISFELTEEQKLAQSMVHELAGSQLRPAARGADDREAIPSSIFDEIWATGIIQSQADATARSATLNALLLEEFAVADASFAIRRHRRAWRGEFVNNPPLAPVDRENEAAMARINAVDRPG